MLGLLALTVLSADAARITEVVETSFSDRGVRFFTFQDPSLRYALFGSMLIGICCGLMGAFLVVRKLALMGDALSHAVLPGVALGFLWNMEKDPVAIFVGATLVGLIGAGVVQLLRQTTRHKEDAALGFVLASFFAVGICLIRMVQNVPGARVAGLESFMFGQAASLSSADVTLLCVVCSLCLGFVWLFYKEYKVTSFDPGFAQSLGLPTSLFHYSLMLLLAFAIVGSLQAVGVVLVCAMLIIPAATSFLITDRFGAMLILSASIGMVTGAVGSFFSFVGRSLPTGPFMVLAAATVFFAAFLFAPRHGVLTRWFRRQSRSARIKRENTLKALFHVLESKQFQEDRVTVPELAERRRETLEDAQAQLAQLKRFDFLSFSDDREAVYLTPAGWQRACEIIRNHRLWELYLTNAAAIAPDHVHEEAEKIEHVLGEEVVRRLERQLNFATQDPHGKLIPGLADIHAGPARLGHDTITGYGRIPLGEEASLSR